MCLAIFPSFFAKFVSLLPIQLYHFLRLRFCWFHILRNVALVFVCFSPILSIIFSLPMASSVGINIFGDGSNCYSCYCMATYRPSNTTYFRQTTTYCKPSNSTKYRGFKVKSKSGFSGIKMFLKVLLLTIAINMTITLSKKFTLDGITFCTIKHPIPYYGYITPLFDAQFGNKSIPNKDLINEDIIVDQSDYKQINSDVINHICNFITAHVKNIVHSDGDDCQNK